MVNFPDVVGPRLNQTHAVWGRATHLTMYIVYGDGKSHFLANWACWKKASDGKVSRLGSRDVASIDFYSTPVCWPTLLRAFSFARHHTTHTWEPPHICLCFQQSVNVYLNDQSVTAQMIFHLGERKMCFNDYQKIFGDGIGLVICRIISG
jgi:hypothetical protein